MLLLVVQPLLYSRGKIKTHRYLGWSSLVLVPLIIAGGLIMMKLMVHRQASYPPNTVYQLAFIDILTLLGFAVIWFLAIRYRKKIKLHARFMVSTIFGPLIPALTRVFFVLHFADGFTEALTYSYLLIEIILIVIILKERKVREMRFTYLPVFIYMVLQHISIYFAGNWEWWRDLLNSITNYS
jgi:hypothetical protein